MGNIYLDLKQLIHTSFRSEWALMLRSESCLNESSSVNLVVLDKIFTIYLGCWDNDSSNVGLVVLDTTLNLSMHRVIRYKKHTDVLMFISSIFSLIGTHSSMHIKRKWWNIHCHWNMLTPPESWRNWPPKRCTCQQLNVNV